MMHLRKVAVVGQRDDGFNEILPSDSELAEGNSGLIG
jgi:hypothetical protein